ncbi:NAD(P)H-dependent glycerol-3-phosphate dehydrogenase [Actinomycetospora sp. C-140]
MSVIGAGSWGTTVGSIVAGNTPTTLWARNSDTAREVCDWHTNERYLDDLPLDPRLTATADPREAARSADVILMAVPSSGFRAVLSDLAPYLRPWVPIVSLTKGLETSSRLRMTQIVADVLPGHPAGVLSGPNIAVEVVQGLAAAAVIAMPDERLAAALQRVIHSRMFRVYTTTDVIGTELCGALKNVVAIAAGMAQGLGAGDNTRATVIARSLAEMTRLGVAMGGRPETFAGLAGMGDLIATCMSPYSRNRQVGEQLARGLTIEEINRDMKMVAEGVKTSAVVNDLAEQYGIDMPISREVYLVTHGHQPPSRAFRGLLRSMPTTEAAAG